MEEPLRVLIVEHRLDRRIAQQLLTEYDLDFGWQCTGSPREMRAIATQFAPDMVLCSDDLSASASHAVLDGLRLLCPRTPVILVLSVREREASPGCNMTTLFLQAVQPSAEGLAGDHVSVATAPRSTQDQARLRRYFSTVLDSSGALIVMSDSDGWITYANTRACRQLDSLFAQSIGTLVCAPLDQGSHAPHWLDLAHDSQQGNRQYSVPFTAPPDNIPPSGRLHRLAYFDAQTGHPTLIHMNDLRGCSPVPSRPDCTASALVAVNLDSVCIPHDTYPAAMGGGSSKAETARYGKIARITADDFLVVLPDLSLPGDAVIAVQGVLDSSERFGEFATHSHPVSASLSLAVARAPGVGPPPNSLAAANRSHSPLWPQMPREADREAPRVTKTPIRLEVELGDAIQRHALSVHFQPQYELTTGRGCGVEALARWVLSTGEIIPPSVFIPLAERAGTIHDLGAWILRSACETAYAWCNRGTQRTTLSVNVSALQIDEAFCAVVERTLKESGFPAKQLELEITESALLANTEATIDHLKEWKKLGVQIAVDDFGTGYSSLSYLSRLPVDRLKVDQSLVHMMTRDSKSAAVMRSIVSLGAELGIDVIAEGVETEQQFHMLVDLGCPRVQGYLLARPMPAHQAQVTLRKTWGNRARPEFHALSAALEASHAH
jgi:EAL domain-containing protein (putative c-di-GMP-specific phosphodiesterase class I)/PAS domain-containing protein